MGVTLATLISNSQNLDLMYEGNLIQITYFSSRVNEKVIAQMSTLQTMTDEASLMDGFRLFNETLCHLLKSWNIFEDAQETIMFPLEPDRIRELPIKLRMMIWQAIINDYRPEAVTPQAMKNGA